MKFIRKNTCAGDFFKYSRMTESVQSYQEETPTKVFSCICCEFLRHLSIYKIICEQLLLKVKLILFKVCKLSSVWLKFISKLFSKQLFKRLFLKVQHFQTQLKRGCFFVILQKSYISERLLYKLELFIYVPLMSCVLVVILFAQQNILILFKRNPRVTKTNHM